MQTLKHAKIVTIIPQSDGSELVETITKHEDVKSIKQQIHQNILTTRTTLLKDVIGCLNIITQDISKEMSIEIKHDHDRIIIVQTWTVSKQQYN